MNRGGIHVSGGHHACLQRAGRSRECLIREQCGKWSEILEGEGR